MPIRNRRAPTARLAPFLSRAKDNIRIEGSPYINHLLEVTFLVAEATSAKDTIHHRRAFARCEDQGIEREEIATRFGDDVASLVQEVTDDNTLPSKERKRLQVEYAPRKSRHAKVLKLADKSSNIRSIASDPPDWSGKRRLAYVQWGRAVVAGLRGASSQLERQFDEAAREAEELNRRPQRNADRINGKEPGDEEDKAREGTSAEVESRQQRARESRRHREARQGSFGSSQSIQDREERAPRPDAQDEWSITSGASTLPARQLGEHSCIRGYGCPSYAGTS